MNKYILASILIYTSINYAMGYNNTHPIIVPQQVVIHPLLMAIVIGGNANMQQQENKIIYPPQKPQFPKQDERNHTSSRKKYIIHQPSMKR